MEKGRYIGGGGGGGGAIVCDGDDKRRRVGVDDDGTWIKFVSLDLDNHIDDVRLCVRRGCVITGSWLLCSVIRTMSRGTASSDLAIFLPAKLHTLNSYTIHQTV